MHKICFRNSLPSVESVRVSFHITKFDLRSNMEQPLPASGSDHAFEPRQKKRPETRKFSLGRFLGKNEETASPPQEKEQVSSDTSNEKTESVVPATQGGEKGETEKNGGTQDEETDEDDSSASHLLFVQKNPWGVLSTQAIQPESEKGKEREPKTRGSNPSKKGTLRVLDSDSRRLYLFHFRWLELFQFKRNLFDRNDIEHVVRIARSIMDGDNTATINDCVGEFEKSQKSGFPVPECSFTELGNKECQAHNPHLTFRNLCDWLVQRLGADFSYGCLSNCPLFTKVEYAVFHKAVEIFGSRKYARSIVELTRHRLCSNMGIKHFSFIPLYKCMLERLKAKLEDSKEFQELQQANCVPQNSKGVVYNQQEVLEEIDLHLQDVHTFQEAKDFQWTLQIDEYWTFASFISHLQSSANIIDGIKRYTSEKVFKLLDLDSLIATGDGYDDV